MCRPHSPHCIHPCPPPPPRRLCRNTAGSRPKEIFLDVIDELEGVLEADSRVVEQIMQVGGGWGWGLHWAVGWWGVGGGCLEL